METGVKRAPGLLPLASAVALACLPVAVQAGEKEDMLAAAHAAFAPYMDEAAATVPDWELPIYSRGTAALIARWAKGLSPDEVEDLNGFGWFCQCQDFDTAHFRVTLDARYKPGASQATVAAQVNVGWDETTLPNRLAMVREDGGWRIDDLFSESFPQGLKAALHKAVAEHVRR